MARARGFAGPPWSIVSHSRCKQMQVPAAPGLEAEQVADLAQGNQEPGPGHEAKITDSEM